MNSTIKKNVLITGGTGFIGNQLTQFLLAEGFTVSILSRSKRKNTAQITYYQWDVANQQIDIEAIVNTDYIIHLTGTNIAEKRWSEKRKKLILSSREDSIQLIYDTLKKHQKSLDGFISASAIGIYGAYTSEKICDENTSPANDYLGVVCQKWESAADKIASLGIRTVKIRTGLVLGKKGGFLQSVTPIFKFGFGAALGSGKQYVPWIHIDDLCSIYVKSITDETLSGPFNAAIEDNTTTNTELSKKLCSIYGHKLWLPNVPAFVLQIIFGKMSVMFLKGQRISSDKLKKSGFVFRYTYLEKALEQILS